MDLSMPVMDGIEATNGSASRPRTPMSSSHVLHRGEDRFAAALAAGAIGYPHRTATPRMSSTRSARPPSVTHRSTRGWLGHCSPGSTDPGSVPCRRGPAVAEGRIDGLSLRRRRSLPRRRGLANKQIARALGISDRTVKTHLANIFRNIGARPHQRRDVARDHGIV